jgi:hypothetical protein
MTPSPRPTAMQSGQRKITGPREMPRSGSMGSHRSGAARLAPATISAPDSPGSYKTMLISNILTINSERCHVSNFT